MDKLFFILYSIGVALLILLASPYLVYLSLKKSKYKESIPARFFSQKNPSLKAGGIWFHVCSLGEAKAIAPLLQMLPKEMLRVTSITQTGHNELRESTLGQSRFLPFEPILFGWLKPQKVLIVMEAELWYLLFRLAKNRGAKTLLINARISDKSLKRYQKASFLYQHVFRYIDEVYAQTDLDKQRLELLGANNITVTGNIKLFSLPKPSRHLKKRKSLVVCAASTHEGEEFLILEAFNLMKQKETGAQLLLAPRHPERFARVISETERFAKQKEYTFGKYSEAGLNDNDIIVVDTLGMLVDIYAISDIVILGGSFVSSGGHNAAEAAQFGCKMISGESYYNQKDIYAAIEGIKIVSNDNLAIALQNYISLPVTRIIHSVDIAPILTSIQKEIKESTYGTSL